MLLFLLLAGVAAGVDCGVSGAYGTGAPTVSTICKGATCYVERLHLIVAAAFNDDQCSCEWQHQYRQTASGWRHDGARPSTAFK